ncbi:MAG: mechanosensitive ion channel family protein [Myxococcales bacterium]|nr:mechanosensitive ion channel family protein [Myxococcales bacterium]
MFDAILEGDFLSVEGVALGIVAVMLLLLGVWLPKEKQAQIRLPAGLLVVHLVLVTILALVQPQGRLTPAVAAAALFTLLASMGRASFLLIFDCLFGHRSLRPLPKIFREILQGFVYVAVLFITLRASGVDPTSLLTTSALLTAIIGLSLQDTLGNLFAGLAIQAEHPFEVGDWIQFDDDPAHVGRVLEINWRATKLVTLENALVVVPNGVLAKTPLANFNKPTKPALRAVEVIAPYGVPPQKAHRILLEAIRGVSGVAAAPVAPNVLTRDFSERGVVYQLRYFIDDFEARLLIESKVRDRVWYALQRAEIAIPPPLRDVRVFEQSASEDARHALEERQSHRDALAGLDFLGALPDELMDRLAALVHTRLYTTDEVIFRQGEAGDELYIILRGEVSISLETGNGQLELTKLGPGKFFGEMSMLTDSVRHATVRALRESELLVVEKGALQQILERSPELAETIQVALRDRQAMLQELSAEAEGIPSESMHAHQGPLLGRIRDFFSL